MAAGSGDTLSSLAGLMEVEESNRADFYAALQTNFDVIFASENVTAAEILSSINSTVTI